MDLARCIINSQKYKPDTPIDISQFLHTKDDLIGAFLDRQLIKSSSGPITLPLSNESKRKKYKKFCEDLSTSNDRSLNNLSSYLSRIPYQDFYTNHYENKKIVRSFKNYITDYDLLRKTQDKASTIIQHDKLTGILCLSAHPMDFLTASDNSAKWRSCYAPNGDWRLSPLCLLKDTSTLMVYLREDAQPDLLPGCQMKWNNKLWRMFLHVSTERNMIIASKQYPFEIDGILDIIHDQFFPNFTIWSNEYIKSYMIDGLKHEFDRYKYIPLSGLGGIIDLKQQVQPSKNVPIFNDLLTEDFYPYYCFKEDTIPTPTCAHFHIAEPIKCLCCGKEYLDDPTMMLCPECMEKWAIELPKENFSKCPYCNKITYKGAMEALIDDKTLKVTPVCDQCAKTLHLKRCSCGALHRTNRDKCPWCVADLSQYSIFDI